MLDGRKDSTKMEFMANMAAADPMTRIDIKMGLLTRRNNPSLRFICHHCHMLPDVSPPLPFPQKAIGANVGFAIAANLRETLPRHSAAIAAIKCQLMTLNRVSLFHNDAVLQLRKLQKLTQFAKLVAANTNGFEEKTS